MPKRGRLGGQFKPNRTVIGGQGPQEAQRNRKLFKASPAMAVADKLLGENSPWRQPKEEASLADQFVASTYTTGNNKQLIEAMMRYRIDMRHAHRFILTDEFVKMATIASQVKAEKILSRIQYATLPYDTTWIEFNLHAKMKAISDLKGEPFDGSEVPERLGLLLQRIDDNSAICTLISGPAANGDQDGGPLAHTTCYYFSTIEVDAYPKRFGCQPMYGPNVPRSGNLTDEESARAIDLSKATLWGYFVGGEMSGSDMVRGKPTLDLRVPDILRKHGGIGTSRMFFPVFNAAMRQKSKTVFDDVMIAELREFTGTVRWLVTVLAMMNEVPVSTEHVEPTGYQRAGRLGKNRLLDYHKVSLVLPKKNPVKWLHKRLSHEEISRRRAHEVRAHWRTYLPEPHCGYEEHVWEYDSEHGYRLCGKCMAYGRLIHEHIRGDANLGWVNKEYVVRSPDG